jgi:hypothetical protein
MTGGNGMGWDIHGIFGGYLGDGMGYLGDGMGSLGDGIGIFRGWDRIIAGWEGRYPILSHPIPQYP